MTVERASDKEIDLRMAVLTEQRNAALNEAVALKAQLILANDLAAKLQAQINEQVKQDVVA